MTSNINSEGNGESHRTDCAVRARNRRVITSSDSIIFTTFLMRLKCCLDERSRRLVRVNMSPPEIIYVAQLRGDHLLRRDSYAQRQR